MIEMLRVDDRLIHGQIAIRWTKYLMVDSIVVANDEAATDKLLTTALKLACPKDLKLMVCKIDEAIELLNNPKLKERKILVIVNQLPDALELLKNVNDIKVFNIGNYGKNTKEDNRHKKMYSEELMADEKDLELLREIISTGAKCTVQLLPDRECLSLESLLNKNRR